MERIAAIAVSKRGAHLANNIKGQLPGVDVFVPEKWAETENTVEEKYQSPLNTLVSQCFRRYSGLVLIMAAGIAVRTIAKEIKSKHFDPSVVVVDDGGRFAISLLSGHIGGANELAAEIAKLIGAVPVITTASDNMGAIAVDLLGKKYGWGMEVLGSLTKVSAAVVNEELIGLVQEAGDAGWRVSERLPAHITLYKDLRALAGASPKAALIITDRALSAEEKAMLPANTVIYRPKTLILGIGCNRNTTCKQIEDGIAAVLQANHLSFECVRNIATIDLKADEAGLNEFAFKYHLPIAYYDKAALSTVNVPSPPSGMVDKHIGIPSVCEAAAILSSGNTSLISNKKSFERTLTIALARLQ